MSQSKLYATPEQALEGIVEDGQTITMGGFGFVGVPGELVEALRDTGVKNLTCIAGTAGGDDFGVGVLLKHKQIKKLVSSYVGENKILEQQFFAGELEVEFSPQGTIAEKLRAGGSGIPAFYTATGVGTIVNEGKTTAEFNGKTYLLEESYTPDIALVKAHKADKAGNLRFRETARNFNPDCAMAAKITIVEVEELVEIGEIDPDDVHLPGIYVQRLVLVENPNKPIERLTVKAS